MKKKRTLGFWKIWNSSFRFLSIQLGFAVPNVNGDRIFQKHGIDIDKVHTPFVTTLILGFIESKIFNIGPDYALFIDEFL